MEKMESRVLAIISNETRLQKLIVTRVVAHPLLVHSCLGSNNAHWRMVSLVLSTGNCCISEIICVCKKK